MVVMDESLLVNTDPKSTILWLTNPQNHLLYTPGWNKATLQDLSDDSYTVIIGNAENFVCNRIINEDSYSCKVEIRKNYDALGQCAQCRMLTSEYSMTFKVKPREGGGSVLTRNVSHLQIFDESL